MMTQMIVFLGNPGKEYQRTRHNAAWLLLERNEPLFGSPPWRKRFGGSYAKTLCGPEKTCCLHLLKPATYMNRSGESVRAAVDFFHLSPQSLLVVHDDLELPFGTVSYHLGGGLGGHNGLRSLRTHLGSTNFFRFRLGISRPPLGGNVSEWVLSPFSLQERPLLDAYLPNAAKLLFDLIVQDLPSCQRKKHALLEAESPRGEGEEM